MAQIQNLGTHTEKPCTEKFVCFLSGSVKLQIHENGIFFTPVKYTLVCFTPWVSWTTRHTTMCLDLKFSQV